MNMTYKNGRAENPTKPSGFTLIELLVVIAIIMILASLLLPSLVSSKQKARITQCLSNFRQLGIGIQLFTHDSQDQFPHWDRFAMGGFNPQPGRFPCLPPPEMRPLYHYIKPS